MMMGTFEIPRGSFSAYNVSMLRQTWGSLHLCVFSILFFSFLPVCWQTPGMSGRGGDGASSLSWSTLK